MSVKNHTKSLIGRIAILSRYAANHGKLPSLLILGAQKAGTSSLYSYLRQHPHFCASTRKEAHYFDSGFRRPDRWYKAHFANGDDKIGFEATPYYLFHPAVPARIKEVLPDARFVVLLRDPVARTVSHYYHEVAHKREKLPLLQALEAEETRLSGCEEALANGSSQIEPNHQRYSYLARSRYAEQIERWFEYFPRSQFLFLIAEDMFREPKRAVDAVSSFMGVPTHPLRDMRPQNQRTYKEYPQSVVDLIRDRLAEDTSRLPDLIGTTSAWVGKGSTHAPSS